MRKLSLLTAALILAGQGAQAAVNAPLSEAASPLTYADLADLALSSGLVAELRIVKAERIDGKAMPMPPAMRRYLVTATVTALIRGAGGLAPQVNYLADVGADSLGRFPKLKKANVMVFAVPVASRPGEIRLVAPDAQQILTPALSAKVRAILAAAANPGAPPRILRVGDAFHVPGTVTGESETQIFLAADDGRPLSLSIWRRPGETPRWAVSLGEIVDEGAEPPARDTLLWYRLACFLPRSLPSASVDALDPAAAATAAEDYATVIAGLGNCPRARTR